MAHPDRLLFRIILLGSVLLFCSRASLAVTGAESANSCVHCHSRLPSSSFLGVKYHSWSGSIHQKHGVTCDQCHGGNPDTGIEIDAHVGVTGSGDPSSKVYFKNVPSTCGRCHGAEFYKFKQSLHYKMLESTGKGPECVTCHGSMVTTILSPDNLVTVCDRCHNDRMGILPYIPAKAKAVLLLLRESQYLLEADQKLYHPAKGTKAARHLRDAATFLHSAKLEWHTFDLDTITQYLQQMYDSVRTLKQSDNGTGEGKPAEGQPVERRTSNNCKDLAP